MPAVTKKARERRPTNILHVVFKERPGQKSGCECRFLPKAALTVTAPVAIFMPSCVTKADLPALDGASGPEKGQRAVPNKHFCAVCSKNGQGKDEVVSAAFCPKRLLLLNHWVCDNVQAFLSKKIIPL